MPVSKIINETKEKLMDVLNNSGLHVSVLELLVESLYRTVRDQAEIVAKQEENQTDSSEETTETTEENE